MKIYEIGNDRSYDSVYSHLFTFPGIVLLRDFPLTESRFRVLRQSFSYEEIVEELEYCIGSKRSAEQLAWFVKDNLITADAFYLYPEVIRVVLEASVATIVHDDRAKEQLSFLYPGNPIFCIPNRNYDPVFRASEYLKSVWAGPGPNFPKHLQPLSMRIRKELSNRFDHGTPEPVVKTLRDLNL